MGVEMTVVNLCSLRFNAKMRFSAIILLLPLSTAAQTQVPNVFEDGTPASAAEVNENFAFLESRTKVIAKAGDRLLFENGFSWIATGYQSIEPDGTVLFKLGNGSALLDGKYFDLQITSKYYVNNVSGEAHVLCPSGNHYPREITMIFSSLAGYVVFQSQNWADSMEAENEYASLNCGDGSQTTYVEVAASAGIFKCATGFLQRRIASYAEVDLPFWTPESPVNPAPAVAGVNDAASSGVTTGSGSYLEIPVECP